MKKIADLNKELLLLKKEIAKFQEDCKHQHKYLKALKNSDIRVVCQICDKTLRWPSKNEIDDWLKK